VGTTLNRQLVNADRSTRIDSQFRVDILNIMLNYQPSLDLMFQALSDPTRRGMVERLSRGPASVSELARPFEMSLPAIVQHLQVLESSGLVRTEKVGRVRTCRIEPMALSLVERWIAERRTTWERRFDRLGAMLAEQPDEPN
jgi:DNA-binding transcriptional ArsR family regulator